MAAFSIDQGFEAEEGDTTGDFRHHDSSSGQGEACPKMRSKPGFLIQNAAAARTCYGRNSC